MRTSVLAAGLLDAASVLVDVLFAIVVAVAVVVVWDLGRRSLRAVRARRLEHQPDDEVREPVPVPSWRPESERPSVALPARPPSAGTYGTAGGSRRFREDPGRLL